MYFNKFGSEWLVVKPVGIAMNTLSLVEKAFELRNQEKYDQVWCVFDKDDWTVDDFDNAIKRARKLKMRVAYSNECFELWYLLHFEYLHTGISRQAYVKKLETYLPCGYQKKNPNMYRLLECNMKTAISNAKRLLSQYGSSSPGGDNPSTTVHELVEELLKQAKPLYR